MTDLFKKYKLYADGNELPYIDPNQETERFWIYARRRDELYPKNTEFSGKWLIFVDATAVNTVWKKIKKATETGLLGSASKVSTAKAGDQNNSASQRVICVFTYNYKDEEDVLRIRQQLVDLGITQKIPYKSDLQTQKQAESEQPIMIR